jgi:hypothetical protein
MTPHRFLRLAQSVALGAALSTSVAQADAPDDTSRTFDRYSWVTTHNAFTSNGAFPNQDQTIDEQLMHGVRSLMLDLHGYGDRVALCHNTCTKTPVPFADLINGTLLPFLEREPDAVLSLHLEDFNDSAALIAELDKAPGLAGMTFNPEAWTTPGWPTYQAIVDSGQRILIFTLNNANSGEIQTMAGPVHFMRSDAFTVENYWSLGAPIVQHDNTCRTRWDDVPLSTRPVDGKPGWPRLFTMNHFHDASTSFTKWHVAADNAFDRLHSRYLEHCKPAAGRKPNFVAVDFHQEGEAAKFVDWLNLSEK